MFKSIFAKQFVFYMSALLISFVVLAVALGAAFNSYFISQKAKILEEQARRISTVFYTPKFYDGWAYNRLQLENEVSVLHEYLNSSFIFLNEKRAIVMMTSDIVAYSGGTLDAPAFEPVFDGEVVTVIGNVSGIFTENVLTVGYPVVADGVVVGAVLLSSSMPELQRSASEMFRIALICLLISSVIAFLSIFILSRTMSKPLREMNEAAKVIANGDFEKRIISKSKDEVGQLAQSFNNMAESLFEQEQLRRIFIANVSHDLRSPLTSIRGFLQAILDGTIPPEKQSHYLNIVMDETERLSKLTHDIIDLNKIQLTEIQAEKSDFELNELIRKTVLMFESVVMKKNIAVALNFSVEKTMVHANAEMIQRVIYNLVDNAVKFSPDHSPVTVETLVEEKKVLITVTDLGRGITQEEQKHVFERFYKADASRGEHKEGSGLGLSIVSAFVKAHGETVTLKTEMGKGCQFAFKLPLAHL